MVRSESPDHLADLPVPLSTASAAMYDGSFYVIGGTTDDGTTLSSAVHRYDPTRNTWTRDADMPFTDWGGASSGHGARFLVRDHRHRQ